MNPYETLTSLQTLVRLRDADVDRLRAELDAKRRLQERYRRNIERMDALCGQSGASAAALPALALNCAGYKGALLQLMASQRQDLALAEADAAVSRQALTAATLRREAMAQARDDVAGRIASETARREQRRCDESAGQAWWRGRRAV
ncbi:flagellar export protein FliJ [Crenobacter luteus]|uniref:Flagellar FliJ protein n=1 Tax=Crenobacter luteus TaxID=1452487 RepID=A0A165F6V1_9NEIS|nr:flagellar export protein FliJ [Crenobacter luteus]KZE31739.1 flagellar export protein FliJ [Crenobacter luteus]TCP15603.1 flagellar export protein FliJ [Crenobacter luteus]